MIAGNMANGTVDNTIILKYIYISIEWKISKLFRNVMLPPAACITHKLLKLSMKSEENIICEWTLLYFGLYVMARKQPYNFIVCKIEKK